MLELHDLHLFAVSWLPVFLLLFLLLLLFRLCALHCLSSCLDIGVVILVESKPFLV